ncbi:alkaline phosphatase D family protein [Quisquiliibacterium transsilvanicum]|uniref:Alkaline phosphatase D n=1 Tax=Quisquiliibacterium transsilvanicum TaxID=1549638 RepID=A0A7W8HH25_9BURK|nr:alkaline phosphatase D family protein [Quisquiliibacterium transsilvanicum]MBB5271944.1 alkaline phosphatase D [Quisquiliibacterium transsilvanicum]
MSHSLPRREFIIRLASVSAVLAAGASLSACGSGDGPSVDFAYGVASGDPLADRVILWTHARLGDRDDPVELAWEVATDPGFTALVSSGTVIADASTGFTAKVDATGLAQGQSYYYRFRRNASVSPVGQTRTLPASGATEVRFAVFSCPNYPNGFFNAYAEAARSDAQYAIHLGDYIYEYEAGGYASQNAAALGRVSDPPQELLSLDDYRRRHAQYKSDIDAKLLHARMPMIAVWDDHEIANDAWRDGAENHHPATEGSYAARRAAALQAYHEWMPIRTGADRARIYRSFDFGSLLSLHMLDTRHLARDLQVDQLALGGLKGPQAQAAAYADFTSPTRQMLGLEQQAWLQGRMAASTATWQVLGQQVLMGRMEFPASVLVALNPADTSPEAQAAGQAAIAAYLTAKATPPAQRTPQQNALMDPAQNPLLGYNLDAWDGYIVARETLLATALQLGKKLVCLSGDTHNAWHNDLTLMGLANPALASVKVGEEFATPAVSSPGLESYLAIPPAQIEAIFGSIVNDLNWMDSSRRGFLKMSFTATEARGDWVFVDTIASRSYTATVGHSAVYQPS